ncbi:MULTISPECIES: biotin transporter BioY [unclassified Rhizobium]|uniref:biotin transporter BioY n=1 Tax=unclassified Rhizobium TaxID=2613769 RepID=UPI000DDDF31A|nr:MULTISPECIES: biotin transporter BioY [unclassified Rhizobium]MBB3288468.1 biotin transport system substrate-specific component [Rhizobium sp. BK252]MBB3403395.1 biotin transport system substrate-specific component [Rhizobium sp. BK289]MBB3415970.1 biotin transport system substrate-specific component [Rhizobium sp. BK284]MBB3483858.1 biotin transport system substrate-specific component [Rhizobium sp. BK347]MDK4722164.1 biotin transporter BioY [Rhizobium sp. CNPSo 3968]
MSLLQHQDEVAFDPLRLGQRSLVTKAVFVLAGTLILALASQIAVPMVPVPITMQTFAITMIGALYGWRLGAVTVLAWLGEAAIGFPVLAGGAGGIASFMGPTAGYLASFPIIAALVGWLAERGWSGNRVVRSFLAHLSANILCLAIGGAWLATLIGAEKGWLLGVAPFVLGAVLKSALAATVLKTIQVYSGKARLN